MPNDPERAIAISHLISGAAFGLVLSVWLVGLVLWSMRIKRRAEKVGVRLKLVEPLANNPDAGGERVLRLWHEGREATTIVPGLTGPQGVMGRIEKLRIDAGMESTLESVLVGLAGALLITAVFAYLLTQSLMAALAAPVAGVIGFYIYINQRIARRRATFERQLIDSLDLAARSLRVGLPLVGSFRMIAEEIPAPVGELFGEVCQRQQLGVAMDRALRDVAQRHDSDDLKLFATCVVIQLQSGGNLADMMERLANVIRERDRLTRRVKVLTTQTEFSKRVLLALPFFIFVLLNFVDPPYMRPLYTTFIGETVLAAAGAGLALGWIVMNWLSKLTL